MAPTASKTKTTEKTKEEPVKAEQDGDEKQGSSNQKGLYEDAEAPSNRSWIKKDYKKLRESLNETRASVNQREVERSEYQPYTWQNLAAYSNTSVGDKAMKKNTKPVKYTPFGLRPGEAIACECCRDSTLKPVAPQNSYRMDNRYRLCGKHMKEAEEMKEKEDKEKEKKEAEQQKQTNQKADTTQKSEKKQPEESKGKQGQSKSTKEPDAGDPQGEKQEEKEKDEPHYMRIPYQLPRERRVVFKPLKILEEKPKDQLNYDDLRKIRKEVREQKQETAAKRRDENYILTQRDWKEMEFDNLYDLRLEGDKKRMQVPIVRYFGAFKKGNREAAAELADPLVPGAMEQSEHQKLDSLLASLQKSQ